MFYKNRRRIVTTIDFPVCLPHTYLPLPPSPLSTHRGYVSISAESQTTRTRDNTRPARGHHPNGYQANGSAEFISRCCLFESCLPAGVGEAKLGRIFIGVRAAVRCRGKYNTVRQTTLRFSLSYVRVPPTRIVHPWAVTRRR